MVSRQILLLGGFVLFVAGLLSGRVLAGSGRPQGPQQPATTGEHRGTSVPTTLDVPGADIADLPRYPNSTRVEYSRSSYDNLVVTEAEYVVEGDAQMLRDYYRNIFDTHGWAVVDSAFAAGEWVFVVVKEEREAVLEIELRGSRPNYEMKLTEPFTNGSTGNGA